MNKDRYYYVTDNTTKIEIAELETTDKKVIESYVEKTRHFIELFRLYKVFRCNCEILLSNFTIHLNDSIIYKTKIVSEEELYTLINTFTINLIASGKTLAESIEVYLKANMGDEYFKKFREESSSMVYDKYFSYRFLNHLRNYSQHGHLPVEINMGRASFNLDDILSKPHIKLNSALKEEMNDIKSEIVCKLGDSPHISFLYTIADYNYYVIQIFFDFINFIKEDLKDLEKNTKKIILKSSMGHEAIFFYDVIDGIYHGFNPNDNIMSFFTKSKKEVRTDLRKEKEELSRIKRNLK